MLREEVGPGQTGRPVVARNVVGFKYQFGKSLELISLVSALILDVDFVRDVGAAPGVNQGPDDLDPLFAVVVLCVAGSARFDSVPDT